MQMNLRGLFVTLLIAAFPVCGEAQTWTWVGGADPNGGGGAYNVVTNSLNWSPTGPVVDLNNTSTNLVFGNSAAPNAYNVTPNLGSGIYQIGTLTITSTANGSIFSGNGTGAVSGGQINGLNIATAVDYSPSGVSSSTKFNPISITGPVFLNGSNVTIGGTASDTNVVELGRSPGGGSSIITSNGNPITKTGQFELELGGGASGLGTVYLNQGGLAVDPYGSGFTSNVVTSSGTLFTIFPNTGTTYSYSGDISGAGAFAKNGFIGGDGGTVVMSGHNTYTGTTIVNVGTLRVGVDNSLPVATTLYVNSGATFEVAANQTIDHFAVSYDGTGSFLRIRNGKTLTVSTASTSLKSTYAGTIYGQGSLVINGSSIPGSFTNSGPVTSQTVISGNNIYSGGTTVNGGALVVNNATGSGLGSGAVTVNNGGQLWGSGSFTGALTLNAGSTVMPFPLLTVGPTTFGGNANYAWLVTDATGSVGTAYTSLRINGPLTITATAADPFVIHPVSYDVTNGGQMGLAANFNPNSNYSWDIVTGASGLSGFATNDFLVNTSNFQNAFNGVFSVSAVGNDIYLNYTAVPEPATSAALAGAFALACALWRRKKAPRAPGSEVR